ncbi:unnamed protein product [Linum trigynum]|uniref:Uncharacterized protein n=1 Tax=Linum trigynum TaxID=586398 RepID=A0AAV2E6C4_9ROSI
MVLRKSMTTAEKDTQAAQEKAVAGGAASQAGDGEDMVTAAIVPPKPTQATTAQAKPAQSRPPQPTANRGHKEGVVEDVTDEEDLRTILKKVLVAQKWDQEARQADSQEIWQAIRNQEARQADSQEVWKTIVELREFVTQRQGQPQCQSEPLGAGGNRAGGAVLDDEGVATTVAAAAAGVTRPGFGSSWPNIIAGLLPTPTAQELAARKGKAKMPGYDTDGPLTIDGSEMGGRFAREGNWLGWLGLNDGLSLVDRQATQSWTRGVADRAGQLTQPIGWGRLLWG